MPITLASISIAISLVPVERLTAAVGAGLLQKVNLGAQLGQIDTLVAVDVLHLVGGGRAAGVGVGLDWGVDVSGYVGVQA